MKTCAICSGEFEPFNSMQVVCGLKCARQVPVIKRKKERADTKTRKEKLKTRGDYVKEAQISFNRYVRLRDRDRPCICCGESLSGSGRPGGDFDCGHYRSVGSAPHLRYDESNAHGQTKRCNRYGAGRAVDYRRGLIERIGVEAVERLEADQTPRHYSIEDLKSIRDKYKAKAKELEKFG